MASFRFDTWCTTTSLSEASVDTLKKEDLDTGSPTTPHSDGLDPQIRTETHILDNDNKLARD